MAKGVKTPPERVDAILEMLEKGVGYRTIAAAYGTSQSHLSRFAAAMKDAKAKAVPSDRAQELPRDVLHRIYARYGIELREEQPEPPAKEDVPDSTVQAFLSMVAVLERIEAHMKNIDDRMSAMQMTLAGLRGNVEQGCAKMIEAVHVEGDIISKEHREMVEALGYIKPIYKKLAKNGGDA